MHFIIKAAHIAADTFPTDTCEMQYRACCRMQQALRPARHGGTYVDLHVRRRQEDAGDSWEVAGPGSRWFGFQFTRWSEFRYAWSRITDLSRSRMRVEIIWEESLEELYQVLATEIERLCRLDPTLVERELSRQRGLYAASAAMLSVERAAR